MASQEQVPLIPARPAPPNPAADTQPPTSRPTTALAQLKEIIMFLFDPLLFMMYSIACLPGTILELLRNGDTATLTTWPQLQSRWFGRFWAVAGPEVRKTGMEKVRPLLEGRVRGGQILPPSARGPAVSGTVIEVGAGSGMWADVIVEAGKSGNDGGNGSGGVKRVLAVEPNMQSAATLTRVVQQTPMLRDVYEVVPHGIEDLVAKAGVQPASVDCIVTVMCLCSIPDPEKNTRDLYALLRPGGRWYVYEHVAVDGRSSGVAMRLYQRLLNVVWPNVMGGCQLCRNTERTLRGAGTWSEVDLAAPVHEPWYQALPHVVGVLTK